MKLPSNSKKRVQILILAGAGALVFLVLAYLGLFNILSARSLTRARLSADVSQLESIDREIKALPALRQSRDNLFWSIQQAATNYILFHEYRNYHLTAREILLPLAAESGVTIDIPKEGVVDCFPIADSINTNKVILPASQLPAIGYSGPASSVFALYPVSLTGRAGFASLLTFLNHIETLNPYLAVSELTIKADPKTPEVHDFSMTLLWPIWKNLELKPKVEDLISPAREYGNASASN
jgi:hypothetical protein